MRCVLSSGSPGFFGYYGSLDWSELFAGGKIETTIPLGRVKLAEKVPTKTLYGLIRQIFIRQVSDETSRNYTNFDGYMETKFFLEDLLDHPVDLVTPKATKPRIQPQIEREAIYVT